MSTERNHFDQMLGQLTSECVFGQAHYRFWDELRAFHSRASRTWDRYHYFLGFSAKAHIDAARVHLHRLLDTSNGAISVPNLIEYADKHPDIFDKRVPADVQRAVQQSKDDLNQIETKVENILKQRNKYFTHLSKEYLAGDYERLFSDFTVTFRDIFDVLEGLGTIINRLSVLLKDSSTLMGFTGEERDVRRPLGLLHEAAEERRAETQEIIEKIKSGDPPRDIKWPKF